jgi:hypothetical protein
LPPQNDTWVWERLIVAKPEMAEQFVGWDRLGGFAWARILPQRPEFADRSAWSKLKLLDVSLSVVDHSSTQIQ